ncbi:C6 transcription factor, partial [Colletotrichum musicola]
CNYAASRRGGLDRAALAERRKRLAATSSDGSSKDASNSPMRANSQPSSLEFSLQVDEADLSINLDLSNETYLQTPSPSSLAEPHVDITSLGHDTLINSYYKNFHKFHPFLLPQKHFIRLSKDPATLHNLDPVASVMRFLGHIYAAHEWSQPLKERVEAGISQSSALGPFIVQARLLYSIALFWHNYKVESRREMDAATGLAVELGMFRQEFAGQYGAGEPVMAESWRRTWWTLFVIDAYYAGTLGTMNFTVVDVEATVDLPCEDSEYESGDIPEPRTLEDFDSREFAPEGTSFSSFAYLISAVKCAALAISTVPKIASKEDSAGIIDSADSIIDGWLLLLPKDRTQVMKKSGEIDELMFQAHLLIQVATIGLHRPLSDLRFNAVEDVSSCAREPPIENPKSDLINVHTVRVLRSVEAQVRLLVLPVRLFQHTPFTTCMVSEGTLALLSACAFLFKGRRLAVARDQIRMTIGCLKVLGEVWPRTAKNVKEIQTIARHVLKVGGKEANAPPTGRSSELPSLSNGEESSRPDAEVSGSDLDPFASLGAMDDVCGWYNLADLGPDLAQWMNVDSSNVS